jgi:hypothetical protein
MKVPLSFGQGFALIVGAVMVAYGSCAQWVWKTTCKCPSGGPCFCPAQPSPNGPLNYPLIFIGIVLIAYSLISIYVSRRQHQRVNREKISTS